MSLAAIPGTFDRVWIASLEPPLSVRAEGSEERTLLYACARFDRFVSMHLVRRTYVDVSADRGNAACDADPPRLFELEEPFPSPNQSLTLHVAPQAPPCRFQCTDR